MKIIGGYQKLKMAQEARSFWKIYSKSFKHKNPTKNLLPVRLPLFFQWKMTRTEQTKQTKALSYSII